MFQIPLHRCFPALRCYLSLAHISYIILSCILSLVFIYFFSEFFRKYLTLPISIASNLMKKLQPCMARNIKEKRLSYMLVHTEESAVNARSAGRNAPSTIIRRRMKQLYVPPCLTASLLRSGTGLCASNALSTMC